MVAWCYNMSRSFQPVSQSELFWGLPISAITELESRLNMLHSVQTDRGRWSICSHTGVCSACVCFFTTQSRRLCNVLWHYIVWQVCDFSFTLWGLNVTKHVSCETASKNAVSCTCPHLQRTHLSASTPVRPYHCLQVTNTGLVEFTHDHAPSVQLVATLLVTSPPRAPIGPETAHTCPIACRWSDVSRERSRTLSVDWAGRRDRQRQSQRDATPWLAEKAVKVNVCCWEKTERERVAAMRRLRQTRVIPL